MFVWWIFVLINLRYIIDYSLFFEYKHLSWNIVNGHLENSQVLQQILDFHECLDLLFLMLTQQKHWWMLMFYFFISLVAENLSPPLYFATCLFQKPLSSDQIRKKKREELWEGLNFSSHWPGDKATPGSFSKLPIS